MRGSALESVDVSLIYGNFLSAVSSIVFFNIESEAAEILVARSITHSELKSFTWGFFAVCCRDHQTPFLHGAPG